MVTPDLAGKVVVVTGANRGIGKETARGIARTGATVVLTSRDAAAGEATAADIRQTTGNPHIDVVRLDLADLSAVRAGAEEILERWDRLDVLVNNAGVANRFRKETADGFEMTFGVNHLGPFLLTNLLLERIKASAPARIVNLASGAHRVARGGLPWDDLQATGRFRSTRAYGESKLANILFTIELADRLQGTGVTANAVHPGGVASGFGQQDGGVASSIMKVIRPLLRTETEGADTSIWAATSPDVEGVTGQYYSARRVGKRTAAAQDREAARRLWGESEKLIAAAGV